MTMTLLSQVHKSLMFVLLFLDTHLLTSTRSLDLQNTRRLLLELAFRVPITESE